MKNSITPTVGRIVLCHTHVNKGGLGDVLPGIIVRVFDDCINVNVFGDSNSTGFTNMTLYSVPIGDHDAQPPESGDYCTWMPYQVGQAKKTQELQEKIDAERGSGPNTAEAGT